MALVAWYPLNGDTLDYSGNKNHATNNGAVIDDNGKIGKCYSFDGADDYMSVSDSSDLNLRGSFTLAAWVYLDDVYPMSISRNIIAKSSNNAYRWRINPDGGCWLLINDGTGYEVLQPSGYTFPNQGWHHHAVTVDFSTGKVTWYTDGVEVISATTTKKFVNNAAGDLLIGAFTSTTAENWKGKINDVRVYNHVLSEREIKELYKAKILHYTFNDFQEPTTNMMDGYTITVDSYPNITSGSDSIGDYFIKSDDSYWYAGIRLPNIPIESGEWYTWSFEILAETSFSLYWDNNISATGVTGNDNWNSSSKTASYTTPNQWQKVYLTAKANDGLTDPYIHSAFCPRDTNIFGKKIYYRNIQLENKPYYTSYTDRSRQGIVRDVSGYGNHAVLTEANTPKWVEDSKLGKGCYEFNPSSNDLVYNEADYGKFIDNSTLILPEDEFTLSFWTYRTGEGYRGGAYITFGKYGEGGIETRDDLFEIWTSAGNRLAYLTLDVTFNIWEHHVLVFNRNDTNILKYYKNGQFVVNGIQNLTYISESIRHSSRPFRIGSSHAGGVARFYNGKMDDVRFYATALSDNDIKELYQTRASLDNKGNLFCSQVKGNIDAWDNEIKNNNLVENGKGEYQSNYNFSSFTYNSTENSFETSDYYGVKTTDNYIKIDKNCQYKLEGEFRNLNTNQGRLYFGVACFDINKNFINHWQTFHYTNTETTLAQDLKDGDTVVYLTSSANWSNTNPGEYYHTKLIGIFDLDSSTEGYGDNYERARIYEEYLYVDDAGPNTITLQEPWSYGTVPAGTKVANVYHGATYNYIAAGNVTPSSTWTKYTGTIGPGWGVNTDSLFRYGTEYIRILFFVNRDVSGSALGVRNVKFYNLDEIQLAMYKQFKTNINNKGIVQSNIINEVGPIDGLVGWWKLDGNVKDYSGNRNYGVISGTPTIVDGKNQLSYYFSGDGSYIQIPINKTFDDFTISFMYKKDGQQPSDYSRVLGGDIQIFQTSSTANNIWGYLGTSQQWLAMDLQGADMYNDFIHVVIVSRYNQVQKVYVNGVDCSSTSLTYSGMTINEIIIGASNTNGDYPFKGWVQDLRLYDRPLNEEEIKILYNINNTEKKMIINNEGIIYLTSEIKEGF